MDFLTHLFLPLTVAYVLWPGTFRRPEYAALAVFGLGPDFDKFLGMPGLLHSLVTLVPLVGVVLALEWAFSRRVRVSAIVAGLLASHLVLDFVGGGPVPLLYPFVDGGPGLTYPIAVEFGAGPLGIAFHGPPVAVDVFTPRPGHNAYGFINSFGVTSLLVFVVVVGGLEHQHRTA